MIKYNPAEQRKQLSEQRRKVDFDTYDVTVDDLVRRVQRKRIDIAPVYQRQFRWAPDRQSRLIESLFLGIPVPPLFMATNSAPGEQVQWEVVDGLQRLLTLVNFVGEESARVSAGLHQSPLILSDLEKVTTMEGCRFLDLPEDIRSALEDRPVKVVILSDKSDLQVRFDLFERLNTGGIRLTEQEIRECVYRGKFMDFVDLCASNKNFKIFIKLPEARWKDGTPQDYILRFFAFLENYRSFEHSVRDFLNSFALTNVDESDFDARKQVFDDTFRFLASVFPEGLRTRKGMTPVNLFEGVAVGAALALRANPRLPIPQVSNWIQHETLRNMTTGATNSKPRVEGRIEFCRDRFLGKSLDV